MNIIILRSLVTHLLRERERGEGEMTAFFSIQTHSESLTLSAPRAPPQPGEHECLLLLLLATVAALRAQSSGESIGQMKSERQEMSAAGRHCFLRGAIESVQRCAASGPCCSLHLK